MNTSIQFRKNFSKVSNIVTILDDRIIKSLPEKECLLEAWKSQKGKEIGEYSDSFYTPAILEKHEGSIVFEKMTAITSMRHMLSKEENRYLAKNIGKALANIHAYDMKTTAHHSNAPAVIPLALSDKVFMHGDFNTYNIQYDEIEKRLCIIDWAPPLWAENHKFCESHYFDISVFIISVFSRRPFEPKTIPDPAKVIDDFLLSYKKTATNEISQLLLNENLNEVMPVFSSAGSTFIEKFAKLLRKNSFKEALNYSKSLEKRGILAP